MLTAEDNNLYLADIQRQGFWFTGRTFRRTTSGPPHIIAIGYLVFSIVIALYLSIWLNRENKRRATLLDKGKEDPPSFERDEERHRLGDQDVHYRYGIKVMDAMQLPL
jgi:hypothetical protein